MQSKTENISKSVLTDALLDLIVEKNYKPEQNKLQSSRRHLSYDDEYITIKNQERPRFDRMERFPFDDESLQCLIAARQNARNEGRTMVHAGDIFVGLLSLQRRVDSKLSRIFQQYTIVLGKNNTFEQPNQKEQIQMANARLFSNQLAYAFQEPHESRVDVYGGIQFSKQAYGVLLQAKQSTEANDMLFHSTAVSNTSWKISPTDIFLGMVTHGDNLGYRAFRDLLPQRTSPPRDFRFELHHAQSPIDRKHVAFRMLSSVR